jgi:hypothetical protein
MGISGMYPIYEEAYRQAAQELGVPARELQSVTWEAIRALFDESDKKSPDFRKAIDAIWRKVEQGKMTQPEAMKEVIDRAGGFKKPDWVPQADWDAQSVKK